MIRLAIGTCKLTELPLEVWKKYLYLPYQMKTIDKNLTWEKQIDLVCNMQAVKSPGKGGSLIYSTYAT